MFNPSGRIEGQRGDYVMTWFDTGAFGARQLYGIITEAGPTAVVVRWESGATNRILRDEPRGCKDLERRPVGQNEELDKYALENLHR